MNSNYEANANYAKQHIQSRLQDAEIHRLVKTGKGRQKGPGLSVLRFFFKPFSFLLNGLRRSVPAERPPAAKPTTLPSK